LTLPRKRTEPRHEFNILEVPKIYFEGENTRYKKECNPFEPMTVGLDVVCNIWVYWVPPENDEEEEEPDPDVEPLEGMLFVCADPEQIPDEALPLACTLSCPGTKMPTVEIAGKKMGPFPLRLDQRLPLPSGPDEDVKYGSCVLANLSFSVPEPPDGYCFRPRRPSPLADRIAELGGCEVRRLMACPQVLGYLKPWDPSRGPPPTFDETEASMSATSPAGAAPAELLELPEGWGEDLGSAKPEADAALPADPEENKVEAQEPAPDEPCNLDDAKDAGQEDTQEAKCEGSSRLAEENQDAGADEAIVEPEPTKESLAEASDDQVEESVNPVAQVSEEARGTEQEEDPNKPSDQQEEVPATKAGTAEATADEAKEESDVYSDDGFDEDPLDETEVQEDEEDAGSEEG